MNVQEKALYEAMGNGEKKDPEAWAKTALPTSFVCKRDGRPKAVQTQKNAIGRIRTMIADWEARGIVQSEWVPNPAGIGTRKVYWREPDTRPEK